MNIMGNEETYTVLARKWRPQQFDDVVGQKHVTDTLKNAIQSNRIAHAYLFVGPRGIGKTSIARILAKSLNCSQGAGPTTNPCGKCDSCKEVTEGRSMDVLEIDGASNNKVEDIQNLRETVKYLPARDRFKIYIIDEVHMLSISAFNALLKTLEEPPPHVKFIFATTESQKILPTIVSRCQRFDLSRIPSALIVQRLADIAKAEKIEISQDALTAVARGAEGGLRDAESAMDQLISFKGTKIVEEDVLAVFGLVSGQVLSGMVEAIMKGDVPVLMTHVAAIDQAGKDLQRLGIDLLSYFRNLLVATYSRSSIEGVDVVAEEAEVLSRLAKMSTPERLLGITDILIEADGRLRYALSKRTLLEVALIRCARAATVVTIDEIISQINKLKVNLGAPPDEVVDRPAVRSIERPQARPAERPTESARPAASSTLLPKTTDVAAPAVVRESSSAGNEIKAVAESPVTSAATAATGEEVAKLRINWRSIVDRVAKIAPQAKVAILDACPLCVEGNEVTIGFDPEFAEHMQRMESSRNLQATQNELGTVLGRNVKIKCRLLNVGEKVVLPADEPVKTVPVQAEPKPEVVPVPTSKTEVRKTTAEWLKDSTVRTALDMFDGEIVDVRE
ncbi:MAG: DNA polymerase III subunit gamma/tau [bacterium]